jgi:dienelactone hydrolase
MKRKSFIALAVLASFAGSACAQRIVVNAEQPVLAGLPLTLRLTELQPGQTVSLRAERAVRMFSGPVALFAGSARFKADAQGRVDLATQAPEAGSSYSGADVRGLLWSMAKTEASTRDRPFNRIDFQLSDAEGKPLATAQLSLTPALPQVTTRKAEAFEGALFASLPGEGKRPTLILLGGSEGGSQITRDAAHWASFGYAVLALPYYSPPQWGATGPMPPELPGLPAHFFSIPVERLEAARDWLAQQPEVDAQRIGVMGTSKGAEFVLLAGTKMPWIKAVAAIVPTDVVWEGWGQGPTAPATGASFAWKGEPFAFVRYKEFPQEFAGLATGGEVRIRRPHDKGRAAATPEELAAARIPVERIAAPVLVAGGSDDQLWDSGGMAAAIAATRAKAGLKTVALVFPEAGHFLGGTGTGPTTHYNDGPMKNGGTPAATARAQAATHAALRQFFADALK